MATHAQPRSFVKSVSLSDGGLAFRIESEKARQMAQAFEPEADLETPHLLGSDESTGELILEHLPTLRAFSAGTEDIWFARVGRALALVHLRLVLHGELARTRIRDEPYSGLVFLHGDPRPKNMGIAKGRLVVFDWGLREWPAETYTRGTPSLDLASFIGPWMVPLWWEFRVPIRKLRVMIAAYLEAIGPDTATARVARETLSDEITAQYVHRLEATRSLPTLRRIFRAAKLKRNYRILMKGIVDYQSSHCSSLEEQ